MLNTWIYIIGQRGSPAKQNCHAVIVFTSKCQFWFMWPCQRRYGFSSSYVPKQGTAHSIYFFFYQHYYWWSNSNFVLLFYCSRSNKDNVLFLQGYMFEIKIGNLLRILNNWTVWSPVFIEKNFKLLQKEFGPSNSNSYILIWVNTEWIRKV